MRLRAAVLILVFAAAAQAQITLELSANAGYNLHGETTLGYLGFHDNGQLENPVTWSSRQPVLSFRFTWNQGNRFGHELGTMRSDGRLTMYWLYAPQERYIDIREFNPIWTPFYNLLVYATDTTARFRPFVSAGPHYTSYRFSLNPAVPVWRAKKWGGNYGGGLKVRLTDYFLLRFDFHDYVNRTNSGALLGDRGWIHHRELSAGFGLSF